jgi:hypothetical protein
VSYGDVLLDTAVREGGAGCLICHPVVGC